MIYIEQRDQKYSYVFDVYLNVEKSRYNFGKRSLERTRNKLMTKLYNHIKDLRGMGLCDFYP